MKMESDKTGDVEERFNTITGGIPVIPAKVFILGSTVSFFSS